ncbi:MAG: hypothetical protein GX029_08300 [Pseudomonadaceae bacterium]|nr:hypothetical protein [Pseudomonadaceae bacterium]
MLSSIKSRFSFSLVLLLLLLTSACGYRLSGFIELPPSLQPLHIESQSSAANLAATLARQLEQSGITLSPELSTSRLRLELKDFSSSQRQVVFGQREEFELSLQITASAKDSEGEALFTNQVFQAYRQYAYKRTESLLARDSLRSELLRNMENDLIRQLTLRIQALQP